MFKIWKYAAVVAMLYSSHIMAQVGIYGSVTGLDNEPLPGAHVRVSHSVAAAYSDADGSFAINGLKPDTLEITATYVGYEPFKSTAYYAKGTHTVYIELVPRTYLTDELVVQATRLAPQAPATFKNIEKKDIEMLNLGQDLPMLLRSTLLL